MSVKVEVRKEGNCLRVLEVEVPVEDVQEAYDRVLRDLKKTARIPGFRVGKAPVELLKKRFASDARHEVIKRLITSSYAKALYDSDLRPLGDPEIKDTVLEENKPFTYKAIVSVRPHTELGQYIGLELEKREVTVFSDDVEQALERLRENHATFESAEGYHAQKGDRIVMDYEGLADGQPFEHNKGQNVTYEIGSRRLIPEFEEALLGKAAGDKFEITVDFPTEYDNKVLAGKHCVFQVEMKDVKQRVLPSLDDEFAKDCGQPSLDELRARIRQELEASAKARTEGDLRDQAIRKIAESSRFELPDAMIATWTTNRLRDRAESLRRGGVKEEDIAAELERIHDRVKEGVIYDLKTSAVIEAVAAAEESIKVEDAEVDESIAKIIEGAGTSAELTRKYFDSPEARQHQKLNLLTKKVLDFIINSSRVTEVQGDI